MPIYTRSGDGGQTSLYNNTRVSKSSLRISTIGSVDELNANLGVARSFLKNRPQLSKVNGLLEQIQKVLFEIGTELAGNDVYQLDKSYTTTLEEAIDFYQSKLPELNQFILPSGTKPAAYLHQTRAVTRRAERMLAALNSQEENLNPELLKFVNRLSDLFFILARYVNQQSGSSETFWKDSPS